MINSAEAHWWFKAKGRASNGGTKPLSEALREIELPACVSRKRKHKLKLFGPDIFLAVFHLKEGVVEKFGMSLENPWKTIILAESPGISAGISQSCPKFLRTTKNICVQFLAPSERFDFLSVLFGCLGREEATEKVGGRVGFY